MAPNGLAQRRADWTGLAGTRNFDFRLRVFGRANPRPCAGAGVGLNSRNLVSRDNILMIEQLLSLQSNYWIVFAAYLSLFAFDY
jgi:hypothetical protein